MQHQCTDLPGSKHKKKKFYVKLRPSSHTMMQVTNNQHLDTTTRKVLIQRMFTRTKRDARNVVIFLHVEDFQCPVKNYQCRTYHKYGHFTCLCFQKKQVSYKPRKPKPHMLQAGSMYACDKSIYDHPEYLSSSDNSFFLLVKI